MGSTKGAESGVRERGRGRRRAESEGTEGSARVVEGAGDGERNGNGERKGGRSRDGERMETRGENGDGENGEAMVRVWRGDGESGRKRWREIVAIYDIVSEYEKCKTAKNRPRDDDGVAMTDGAITFNEFEFR